MKLKGDVGTLEVRVLKRSNSETEDYWDANWLESEIGINVAGFIALYRTNLRVDDLQRFYIDLTSLQANNLREVEFITMEEGLYLLCELYVDGNIRCKGKATNDTGNSLDFKIRTDLVTLDIFISDLRTTLQLYPLIGSVE